MEQMKRDAVMPVRADGSLVSNGRNEISKRTGADFSTILAREASGTAVPVWLPIANGMQHQSQNGLTRSPILGVAQPVAKDRFHERALGLRSYRQELLASNIANADTPGYKAVDIDIEEALRNGQSAISKLQLKYQVPSQGSIDGNTVEMDVERAKFTENALMYEYEVDRVKGYYMMMDDLLKNTPY